MLNKTNVGILTAIIILVIGGFFIYFGGQASANIVGDVTCVEGDAGKDFGKRGVIITVDELHPDADYFEGEDECQTDVQLLEYFCLDVPNEDNSRLGVISVTCDNGCENGRCIDIEQEEVSTTTIILWIIGILIVILTIILLIRIKRK